MDSQVLCGAVAEAFAKTGARTPPWQDPHAERQEPIEEEYSRCLDPGKYRIVGTRADAWVHALTGLGLAVADEVGDRVAPWRDGPGTDLHRAILLRPVRARAVPLLLGFHDLQGAPNAVVVIGAGEPAVLVVSLPECGCDACDDGSDRLLEELDRHVLAVVSGELVHVTTRQGTVFTTGSGWSAQGRFAGAPAIEALLREAAEGRSRHFVVRGDPWW